MQVALLLRRQFAAPTRASARSRPVPGAIVFSIGSMMATASSSPPDHQAVAALEPEDAAAGADVDVVDPLLAQLLGATDVIAIVGVATVDDDVALVQQRGELIDDLAGQAGRDHHPDRARPLQLADELLGTRRPPSAPSPASCLAPTRHSRRTPRTRARRASAAARCWRPSGPDRPFPAACRTPGSSLMSEALSYREPCYGGHIGSRPFHVQPRANGVRYRARRSRQDGRRISMITCR